MIDKKILISIVIVLLIGVTAASYQITTKTPGIWQQGVSQAQTAADQRSSGVSSSAAQGQEESQLASTSSGQSSTGGVDVKVSASEAQTIVNDNIDHNSAPNAVPGTPKLVTLDGKSVYIVPILDGDNQTGEMTIDAQTGKIIEGAGGAPNG